MDADDPRYSSGVVSLSDAGEAPERHQPEGNAERSGAKVPCLPRRRLEALDGAISRNRDGCRISRAKSPLEGRFARGHRSEDPPPPRKSRGTEIHFAGCAAR